MYLVVRRYRAAPQLMDAMEADRDEIERLARDVRGFVAYYLVRTADGMMSVSVYEDRRGAEESLLLAADWITAHAPDLAGNDPEVIEGEAAMAVTG